VVAVSLKKMREGQMVRFTVDAFPDDTYEGVLTQVRKQPTTDQNVVSYTVIAEADNPRRKLLPGMTANADIIIDTRRDVVKVPVQALRWTPPSESRGGGSAMAGSSGFGGAPGGGNRQGGGRQGGGMAGRLVEQLDLDAKQQKAWEPIQAELRDRMQAARAAAAGNPGAMREAMAKPTAEALAKLEPLLRPDQKAKLAALRATLAQGRGGGMRGGTVYVLRDKKPVPLSVRVGATDGSYTEIVSRELKPGDRVIVGGGPRPKAQLGGPMGGPPGAGGGVRVRM